MLRQKIVSLKKPLVIFICGMPGTRKSSTAVELASKLGIKVVIGTDQIRDILRSYSDEPFLKHPTHSCWRLIGGRTDENIAKGYLKQSVLIKKAVLAVLKLAENRGENMIVEGVHLSPHLYSELKDKPQLIFFHFLLWTYDQKIHSANIGNKIGLRHGKETPWSAEKIEEIQKIQKLLLNHKYYGVYLVDSTTPRANVKAIVGVLEKSL